MEKLSVFLDPILPVCSVVLLGFLCARMGVIQSEDARAVSKVALKVFLPLLLFGSIAGTSVDSLSVFPIIIYLLVQMFLLAVGYWIATSIFVREAKEAVLLAICGVFANNALVILPMVQMTKGSVEVLTVSAIVALDGIFLVGFAMVALQLIERGHVTVAAVGRAIFASPVMLAIALAILINVLGWSLPAALKTFVEFNGRAAAPAALLALGVILSSTSMRLDGPAVTFGLIKLIGFPATIWVAFLLFSVEATAGQTLLLASSAPAGIFAFSLALIFNVPNATIARVIVWTSIFTPITMTLLF